MQSKNLQLTFKNFSVVYTTFKYLDAVVAASIAPDSPVLVVRNPHDGGGKGREVSSCQCINADIGTAEGLFEAFSAIEESRPYTLIFTTSVDRDTVNLTTEVGETQLIQELLWRHFGVGGGITKIV